MVAENAARHLSRLDDELQGAVGPTTVAHLRQVLEDPAAARELVVVERHGTVVYYALPAGGPRRRVLELDRYGNPLAALRWSAGALETAWLRTPDGAWLRIEPRATTDAPWGLADRLRRADRAGADGTPLTMYEALDYTRIDRIPTLAEPSRLPQGAATVVLNQIAALAAERALAAIAYRGPYPTEELFLGLLESFLYEGSPDDPLAAFMAGALSWRPAPHERVVTPAGAYVQLRGRVEKVVWRNRTFRRPDWQGVVRHAPRRVQDVDDGVRCTLWVLGGVLAEQLELTRDGEVSQVPDAPPPSSPPRPMPAVLGAGLGAVVAATSVAALASFIRAEAEALVLEWGPVAGDLLETRGDRVRVAIGLRERLAALLAETRAPATRAATALAALAEMAMLLGDTLRARAQARLATLDETEQRARLAVPASGDAGADARAITTAVDALLADAG